MRNIGFIGLMQAGKTTACDYLVKNYGYTKIGFKDALVWEMKDRLTMLLPELASHYEMSVDELFQKKPPLMRKLMQDYGTGVRRGDDNEYWIKRWKESVKGGNICVDDVRFLNELDAVRSDGGIIIRVIKLGQVNNSTHQSELELQTAQADYTIEAEEGELDSIYRQVEMILYEANKNSR